MQGWVKTARIVECASGISSRWRCVDWHWRRPAAAATKTPYKQITEIPIGGEGGWDILTIDSAAHRLYLSHSTKVMVVDLKKNAVVGEIPDTPGVHGFVAVPELGRGFSTNGKESKASVVDLNDAPDDHQS